MSTTEKPAKSARSKKIRQIHVNLDRCKGCQLCVEICPIRNINILRMSSNSSRRGYNYPIVNNLSACTGCCLCEMICPDFAIYLGQDA